MLPQDLASDLLIYIEEQGFQMGDQLPSLADLSKELGISVNKLREQLEVARILGLVDVRPRAGIRVREYSFLPAVRLSLLYALSLNREHFSAFGDLRIRIEASFWQDAVTSMRAEDHQRMMELVEEAWAKLNGSPVRLPHKEHRDFHLTIFSRLENPFVIALLEAYWEAYEAEEYHVYADYQYLREVWTYHEQIARAICAGDIEGSLNAFIEHTRLMRYRNRPGGEPSVGAGIAPTSDAHTPNHSFSDPL